MVLLFTQGYDKLKQQVFFPENIKLLTSIEQSIELVRAPTLQKLYINLQNFRAAKTCAYIFVQDTLECADMEPIEMLR